MAGVLLLIPHWVLATSTPDRYATGVGPGLGDFALLGLLVLSVWALAPGLRAARWPGPIRWLARTYERWLPPQLTDPATKRQRLGVRGVSDKTRVRRCSRTPAPRVSQLLERSSRGDSRNPTPPTFWWRSSGPKGLQMYRGCHKVPSLCSVKSPALRAFRHGASRTRTGDLLGAISAPSWPEFGLISAFPEPSGQLPQHLPQHSAARSAGR
jgi:hypothetical protein